MSALRLILLLLLLPPLGVQAAPSGEPFSLYVDFEQAGAMEIARAIESRGNASGFAIVVEDSRAIHSQANQVRNGINIAVGRSALEAWLQQPQSTQVLSVLVTRYDWQQLLSRYPLLAKAGTAVHADPTPHAQIELAQAVSPSLDRIGLLLHEDVDLAALGLNAERMESNNLVLLRSSGDDRVMQELSLLLEQSDALIAIPDGRLYGPENFRHVLLSAYRQRKPVIGFSGAGVNAGCIAAPYVSSEDLAAASIQQLEKMAAWPAQQPLPQAKDIPASEIRINRSVANALGMQLHGIKNITEGSP